jgi:hypothetical protein
MIERSAVDGWEEGGSIAQEEERIDEPTNTTGAKSPQKPVEDDKEHTGGHVTGENVQEAQAGNTGESNRPEETRGGEDTKSVPND